MSGIIRRRAPRSRLPLAAAPRMTLDASVLAALMLASAVVAPATARPILFPPTPAGPAEWRDERDTAPYLAAWKAARLRATPVLRVQGTVNQAAYDVRTYDLDLAFDPATTSVSGTVRMTATVRSGPLTTLDLDLLANMTVDGVMVDGLARTFTRPGDLVTLSLGRPYLNGESLVVTVRYHGQPLSGGPFGNALGFATVYGRPLIWSLSEPYGARSWWPCKDAPEDKADSVDVRFTVPSGMITASNGRLVSASDDGVTAVSHWHERHPIASYLVSIASYPYARTLDWYRHAPADSMPIEFYNFPEDLPTAAPAQAKVKGMLAAYAARVGSYPFLDEKYGHAEFLFGGGMEHQTCTSLGSFSEYVVAHELGHQWWGDLVTCRNFHHIWLNEGFATYMEALWAEAGGGARAYHADLSLKRYFGVGTVYVPDTTDAGRIFDYQTSYEKGAWVLHMLRHALGDTVFFQALRQYRIQFAYGTAVTEDFEGVCEAVSGRDLHHFFQQWVYGERYPVYRYAWTVTPRPPGVDVTVTLEQTQTWQLFTMPVDVRISTNLGDHTFVADDSLAVQTFTFHVSGTPITLAIDPDEWILRHFDQSVVNPRFDRSVLLVNEASWGYGSALSSAYADKAFSGDYGVDFWDEFDAPDGGYPPALPAPVGHGEINGDVLGRYRNVVWVTDSYGGDPDWWLPSPLLAYLRAGGNLLLMAHEVLANPDGPLLNPLLDYVGVGIGTHSAAIQDCVAARTGLVDMAPILGPQIGSVYDTVRARTDTELLFTAQLGFVPPGALGVIREPAHGAGGRPHGGRLALISGIPFHWDHAPMRTNVTAILSHYFGEPISGLGVGAPPPGAPALALSMPRPNPFSGGTMARLTLGAAARVDAEVLDASGRRVRVIASGGFASGEHTLGWDGRDATGRLAPAGIYWLRVRAGADVAVRKLVRLP